MKTVFDVVDLLQLQEIWVRRPIAQAYARLERRQTLLPCPVVFQVKWLTPRLGELRNSLAWRTNRLEKHTDPAQMPMCALTDAYIEVLFSDSISPAQTRQRLFVSAYNHYVISQYRGDVLQTCDLLRALAAARSVEPDDFLGPGSLPMEGSNFWIPVDLTDEIRALDARYDSSKPDTPAAYVVSEDFWPLLVKATPADVETAVAQFCEQTGYDGEADCESLLRRLIEVARDWNRSSSVVGLYYQVAD